MKQKVFKSIAEPASKIARRRRWGQRSRIRLPSICEESLLSGRRAEFFLQLTTISRFVVCGLHILLSSARMYLIYVIFLCRTSLNLCPLMYCVEPKRIASSLH
jgi:hypothetical protein